MMKIKDFIQDFPIEAYGDKMPWDIVKIIPQIITDIISRLGHDFTVNEGIAIHKSVIIEPGAVLKAPIIVLANSFIGAHAYLRGGVFLGESVVIGPGCEIKSSIICAKSSVAHFNFIGDSIIGSHVNFEAGSITANYHNDKSDKRIFSVYNSSVIDTGVDKFGSLVGDHSKIGANAVLSPGTLLAKNSIVKRLELIDQYDR
jgi:UDP-N-acetylglucosamine diphosphorylase / glucose-1-phosphate thymidylyltransferase / UDP-N-acetylgalactosamine diphosphorylase / glucosamine-1-phosphate N-acetyltransferase / galactosamine-1-phosphate N-acetyltransferase